MSAWARPAVSWRSAMAWSGAVETSMATFPEAVLVAWMASMTSWPPWYVEPSGRCADSS